jgi:two-component system response regulator QseB
MRILVVEDDQIIGDGLVKSLNFEGYAVDWAEDKDSALTAFETNEYEMLLLDIGLPDGSGLDILKEIRQKKNNVPALILTAFEDTETKVQGLDGGADDYLIKPFKLEELKARIRALHRRKEGNSQPILKAGNISLDPASRKIEQSGKNINISTKEFAVLQVLIEKPNKVFSRQEIEDRLYGWGKEIESNAIESHISNLRKKLGKEVIETIKYVGYRFAPT